MLEVMLEVISEVQLEPQDYWATNTKVFYLDHYIEISTTLHKNILTWLIAEDYDRILLK